MKENIYTNYKNYRNLFSTLMKKIKQAYSGFISENKAATVFKTRLNLKERQRLKAI